MPETELQAPGLIGVEQYASGILLIFDLRQHQIDTTGAARLSAASALRDRLVSTWAALIAVPNRLLCLT